MTKLDELSPGKSFPPGEYGTILVVDDESAVRRLAARILRHEGFTVVEAGDGAEALELIRANRTPIDAVVSDIVMPKLNGVELMQALASSTPGLPVILMSGYAAAALADLGIVAPCSILAKPFTPELLLDEVRRCLNGSKSTVQPLRGG